MGLLDTLLGRSKPVQPNLDQLFGLPSAALTLEVNGTFRPTGYGSVCYRKAEGVAFARSSRTSRSCSAAWTARGRGDQGQVRLHLAALPAAQET